MPGEVALPEIGVAVEALAGPPDLVGPGGVGVPPDHGGVVAAGEVDALPDAVMAPRQVESGRGRRRRRREPEQPGAERPGGEAGPGEVDTGEEHQRRLYQFAERLRRGRVAGLPRDQVAELVDVVGGTGGEQRHAERVRPLPLVVLTTEHRGVGERVPEYDPLGKVLLRGRFLGEERGEHGVAREDDTGDARALQLGDDVARVLLRGGDVERVRHRHRGLHPVRCQALFEVSHALGEGAGVVVVMHDAEDATFRLQ